jgi:Tfp pilus assembly protein PilF
MKTRFVFVMIALAALSACATAEENTSDYWYKNAGELLSSSILKNGSIEDALRAYDKAIEIDRNNATIYGPLKGTPSAVRHCLPITRADTMNPWKHWTKPFR